MRRKVRAASERTRSQSIQSRTHQTLDLDTLATISRIDYRVRARRSPRKLRGWDSIRVEVRDRDFGLQAPGAITECVLRERHYSG